MTKGKYNAKILITLQKLNLTYYEAKVYATLVATGATTATTLSTESEVPRTK
ncbi:MAG: helix-turn-helix domain-containing protein, partial [Halobacteriota archaeon]